MRPAEPLRGRTFATRADARRFLEQTGTALQRGDWLDPRLGKLTFAEWAGEWERTTVDLRPTTLDLYLYILRNTSSLRLARYTWPGSRTKPWSSAAG